MKRTKLTQCTHCRYKWQYKGKMIYATCPNCGNKTRQKTIKEFIGGLFK